MKIQSWQDAHTYLFQYISQSPYVRFPGLAGRERAKYLLSLLGSPQNKLKVIHIAGTSGKTSTAYFISSHLASCGLRVGLHSSPHIKDIRERFLIDNQFISKDEFLFYLNKIVPFVAQMEKTKFDAPSYFEILVTLAFCVFVDKKVDFAVVETGLGGLYDGTNVVERTDKTVVLVPIQKDHTEVLGKKLKEIAYQKAMIIGEGNNVISACQDPNAQKVIEEIVKQQKATHLTLPKGAYCKKIKLYEDKTTFELDSPYIGKSSFEIGPVGTYQAENVSLSLHTVHSVSRNMKFVFNLKIAKEALKTVHIPGRFEVKHFGNSTIILDGAHNQHKMDAFFKTLTSVYQNRKFTFIVAFKKDKNATSMLKTITAHAKEIIATGFNMQLQDNVHFSYDLRQIGTILKRLKYANYRLIPDPQEAFKLAQQERGITVVTGSLYLVSSIYNQFLSHPE